QAGVVGGRAVTRPLPADYVQPGEKPLLREGRHPLSIVDELLGILILWGLAIAGILVPIVGFGVPSMATWGWAALAGVTVLAGMAAVARWWRVQTSLYVVTDERVYKAYGRLRFFLLQTTYDKVTDLHVKQSLFGRWWGFGTVTLQTAGTGLSLQGVRDPFGTKQRVEAARRAFLDTLLAEHRPTRRAAGAAGAGATAEATGDHAPFEADDEATYWQGGPTPSSFVGAAIAATFTVLPGIIFLATGAALRGGAMLAVGAGLLFFAAIQAWAAWLRYKYTRFEVRAGGVVVTSGWLTRKRVETTFDKVTDVTTYQDILGRLLNYGRITINTAGSNEAPVVFQGLREADRIKELIDQARRRRRGA
ncbi:MAG: PH domain-containing protein, partial [Thermoplasmatota archaeon]